MDSLTIIQHNVAHCSPYRHILTNTYNGTEADIILINSHGTSHNNTIHIHNYTTHTINTKGELRDGGAILVKSNIKHKITDDFDTDVLQVTIETSTGCHNMPSTTETTPTNHRLPPLSLRQLTHIYTGRFKCKTPLHRNTQHQHSWKRARNVNQ